MANQAHLTILQQGIDAWNTWRENSPDLRPDLSGTNLSRANLSGADFSCAELTRADLTHADGRRANFGAAWLNNADLTGADLSGADLTSADVGGANLSGAKLIGADLSWANLDDTTLCGADLSGAVVAWTKFAFVDLSVAKGLDTLMHEAPSSIGVETLYKSRGNLSEVFLRGIGIPDHFIAYIRSLVDKPVEFYSCFISYSAVDQGFAERLFADLQVNGVRCWFAPNHMAAGQKVHEQIDQAIRLHERLLLILSPASMESEWVKTEISKARKRELKERCRVLFPVRLVGFESLRDWECFDADTGKDSALEIREYFIPDFSRWKDHDSYQQAFDRLLRDLKAEAQKP